MKLSLKKLKIELINNIINKKQDKLDISILYAELFLAYCLNKEINIYNSTIHYENDNLYLTVENDNAQLVKSAAISKYFEGLSQCHNVKHKLHGYEGFYCASIEYVVFNLINNLINMQFPEYQIAWETEFYSTGFGILNNFMNYYKSIEM